MPVIFDDPDKLIESMFNEVDRGLEKGLKKSSEFMAKQIDLTYENQGFLDPRVPRRGFPDFPPTSRVAKMNRKNYPSGEPAPGRQLTQAQAQYILAAPSLEDTGKMRQGTNIERQDDNNKKLAVIGTDASYIKNVETEGTFKGKPKPAREFQIITEPEQEIVESLFEQSLTK